MKNSINFETLLPKSFKKHRSGEECLLLGSYQLEDRQKSIAQIAEICQQELVYDELFRERLKGQPYSKTDAKDFLDWGNNNWKRNSQFLFFITDREQNILAACDIKANTPELSEVGYWASVNSPGVMSNGVMALCETAKAAGFVSLVLFAKTNNYLSQGVAERSGFEFVEVIEKDRHEFKKYLKAL